MNEYSVMWTKSEHSEQIYTMFLKYLMIYNAKNMLTNKTFFLLQLQINAWFKTLNYRKMFDKLKIHLFQFTVR